MCNVMFVPISVPDTATARDLKPKRKRPRYGNSSTAAEIVRDLVIFDETPPAMELATFCKSKTTTSGLSVLKSQDKSIEVVRAIAGSYTQGLVISKKNRTVKAAVLSWYLTEQEELSLVQFIHLMDNFSTRNWLV